VARSVEVLRVCLLRYYTFRLEEQLMCRMSAYVDTARGEDNDQQNLFKNDNLILQDI